MMRTEKKIAIVWRGNREASDSATLETGRFSSVAEALGKVGIASEAVVYDEIFADEVRERLLKVDGVFVCVNPLDSGRDRSQLDVMLRDVAAEGILVSAHPDVILKMGTKEVLFETREMGWGCDTHLYATAKGIRDAFPSRLAEGKARVLKQYRGNGGSGVWRVATSSELEEKTDITPAAPGVDDIVFVRHAQRGSVEEAITLGSFIDRCEPYFEGAGQLIDQAFQERLAEGMVRCYYVKDTVVGFGEQLVNALYPYAPGADRSDAPQPEKRLYYPPTRADFQKLKSKAEAWIPAMLRILDMDADSLPVLWDADFLYGPKDVSGDDTYVLCEINVSAVSPFPDEAPDPLAAEFERRLGLTDHYQECRQPNLTV